MRLLKPVALSLVLCLAFMYNFTSDSLRTLTGLNKPYKMLFSPKDFITALPKSEIKPQEDNKPKDPDYTAELIEHADYSAVMYATEPIGRYYITAYNHKETGSKITASGATVHEGVITTAAADVPKYFKFGDYVEIGGRIYKITDTGSAVKKRHIDIYIADYKTMTRYNSHYEYIYKVTFPFGIPKDN